MKDHYILKTENESTNENNIVMNVLNEGGETTTMMMCCGCLIRMIKKLFYLHEKVQKINNFQCLMS